jgi:hypothetical protein
VSIVVARLAVNRRKHGRESGSPAQQSFLKIGALHLGQRNFLPVASGTPIALSCPPDA